MVFATSPLRKHHLKVKGNTSWFRITIMCPIGSTYLPMDCYCSVIALNDLTKTVGITGMIFVSYLTDFSYVPLERNCRKLLHTVRTGQKWTISKGVQTVSAIFHWFSVICFSCHHSQLNFNGVSFVVSFIPVLV